MAKNEAFSPISFASQTQTPEERKWELGEKEIITFQSLSEGRLL